MPNIVIKNQYSLPNASGKGSRGSSPTAYINNYMSRSTATVSADSYVENYMRVNKASGDRKGVAFTKNTLIADDSEIKRASHNIDKRFKDGYPFMKTVVSFDTDYLASIGVISQDFRPEKKGDLIGQVDESRIRLAVKAACDNLGKNFGDLEYVGCIHLDTKHVHVHLCMSDMDGERVYQKGSKVGERHGKLTHKELNIFKLRVADSLSNERYKMLHVQDVITARHKLEFDSLSDELIDFDKLDSMLPSNKGLWRFDSNAASMKQAKEYINNVFDNVYETPLKLALKPLAANESKSTGKKEDDILDDLVTTHRRRFANSVLQKHKKSKAKKPTSVLSTLSKDKIHKASLVSSTVSSSQKAIDDLTIFAVDEKQQFIDTISQLSAYPDLFTEDVKDIDLSILDEQPVVDFIKEYKHFQTKLINAGQSVDSLAALEYINSKLDSMQAMKATAPKTVIDTTAGQPTEAATAVDEVIQ